MRFWYILIIGFFVFVCIFANVIHLMSIHDDKKMHIVGYQLDKMINAKDNSVCYDTTGTILKKGDSVFIIEKRYSEYK